MSGEPRNPERLLHKYWSGKCPSCTGDDIYVAFDMGRDGRTETAKIWCTCGAEQVVTY